MKNQKGLSTIVATLIIILLVLVAVGIIWVVVRNVVQGGTQQIDINAKCLEVDVGATNVECIATVDGGNDGNCSVTVSRSAGDDEIGGLKLVFTNEDAEENFIHDVPGDLAILDTKTVSNIETGIVNASSVAVIVYFMDDSGNEQLCTASTPYEF